jgi:RNA polymerase sigma-70 factor (ECF subfamily)
MGSSDNLTRTSLIFRARQRDAAAWSELVDLYGPLISYWCRQFRIDEHSAADCVQDVFATVASSLDSFHPQREVGSFRGWLWTVTRNKLMDHFRRSQRNPVAAGGSTAFGRMQQAADKLELPDQEPSGDRQLQELTSRALAQVQNEFESRTWQAFWRSVVDGISTESVAAELQMTPASVRQSRSRILRRLRKQLGDVV